MHSMAKACIQCGTPNIDMEDQETVDPAETEKDQNPEENESAGDPELEVEDKSPPAQNSKKDPETPLPIEEEKYVIQRDFRQYIGEVMVDFKQGRIITDMRLIARLKDDGAPIANVKDNDKIVCCPNCRHVFDFEAEKAKAKKKAMPIIRPR